MWLCSRRVVISWLRAEWYLTIGSWIATEGPTARTATPAGSAARAATVTFRTSPEDRYVALTIDDGPTRKWTPQVHRLLANHGAKATFFVVGERAKADPVVVQQAADHGHELANHTWAHKDLTRHNEAPDAGSLERTHELLTKLTGRAPTLCRPPLRAHRQRGPGRVLGPALRRAAVVGPHHRQ
jgi:peptidoglycan/xylan/chitin deacetylase (PgdA/CDA1 family)